MAEIKTLLSAFNAFSDPENQPSAIEQTVTTILVIIR